MLQLPLTMQRSVAHRGNCGNQESVTPPGPERCNVVRLKEIIRLRLPMKPSSLYP
jgi:hypothetical protein